MKGLIMNGYKVSGIELKNEISGAAKLELNNQYSHNVRYSNNGVCEGIMNVKITDKNGNDKFFLNVTVQGLFRFEENLSREKIHVETFKELFPYARALITNLTANAGMPPIIIPMIDIESQEIFRVDFNPENLS